MFIKLTRHKQRKILEEAGNKQVCKKKSIQINYIIYLLYILTHDHL